MISFFSVIYKHKLIKFLRLDPPELTSYPAARETVNKYDILLLSCVATGNELPSFTWYKDGILLASSLTHTLTNAEKQPDSTSTTSILKVTGVDTSHTGVYSCNATNTLGAASFITYVDVLCEFLFLNFLYFLIQILYLF